MAELSFDDLLVLMDKVDLLYNVEKELRERARTGEAQVLHKLKDDAALAFARKTDPKGRDAKADPRARRIAMKFAPVSKGRAQSVLQQAHTYVGAELQERLSALLKQLELQPPLPPPEKKNLLPRAPTKGRGLHR